MKSIVFLKIIVITLVVVCYLVFSVSLLHAGQSETKTDNAYNDDSEINKQQRWAIFPVIASSPETGLRLGGMLFHFFPVDHPDQQASTIDMVAFATAEEQYKVSLSPNVFFQNNRYRFNSSISYSSWIANYFGLGNDASDDSEKYESKSLSAMLTIEMKVFDALIFGLLGSYSSDDMKTEADGLLQTDNIIGATDADYTGIGIRVGYDTRDNINASHIGALAVYESTWFDKDFGSDYDFIIQTLDLRYFTPMSKDHVLALSVQMKDSQGQVPFRFLPSPDGTMVLRGIENGRYRDKTLLGVQSEYRYPVSKKLTGAVFAEMAQVANNVSDIEMSAFKTSLGIGIRYALNPDQRFKIRADVAWVDNGFGAIIFVREAF